MCVCVMYDVCMHSDRRVVDEVIMYAMLYTRAQVCERIHNRLHYFVINCGTSAAQWYKLYVRAILTIYPHLVNM